MFIATGSHESTAPPANQDFLTSLLAFSAVQNRKVHSQSNDNPKLITAYDTSQNFFLTLCNQKIDQFYQRLKLASFQLSLHHYF